MGLRAESEPPVDEGSELSEYVALLSNFFERGIKKVTLKLEKSHMAHLILLRPTRHKDHPDQIL